MLSDRDYMNDRNKGQGGHSSSNPADANKCVFILIAINVLFLITFSPGSQAYGHMALTAFGMKSLYLWQLVTSIFLHGSWTHLFVNMWGLFLFGTIIAPVMGVRRFLSLYFISGVTGNLLWLAFNWNSMAGVVGASGALFGVMIATAMLYPNKQFMLLLFPVPIKTKTLVIVYAVLEVLMELNVSDNIAHLAHLGGILGGYIYVRLALKRLIAWDPLGFIGGSKGGAEMPHGWKFHDAKSWNDEEAKDVNYDRHVKNPDEAVTQHELDRLLDKISREGINSLTPAEMATLKKAREQMRRH
jgi:membrane associated rhomboid family serine protease